MPRTPGGNGEPPAPQAWLVAAKDAGQLTEFDRLTLHQAVTVVALELLRRRVADDTERRLAGDVLAAMVSGDLSGAELARRLEPFGLGERVGVLVLQPPRAVRKAVEEALDRRGARGGARRPRRRHRPVLVRAAAAAARGDAADDDALFALAERVRAHVADGSASSSPPASAAPSPPATCGARSTRRAARSRRARSATRATAAAAGLATYRDLGSFQLLLALQDDDALRLFCDSILAPIEDGEGAYGGELMRSLEAFIECNGQWERAARAALLPPSYPALSHPPRRGADRPLARLRARPDRLLARAAGPRAGRPVTRGAP